MNTQDYDDKAEFDETELTEERPSGVRTTFFSGFFCGMALVLAVMIFYFAAARPIFIPYTSPTSEAGMTAQEMSRFTAKVSELVETIQKKAVLSQASNQDLMDAMYKGLLHALNDKYSDYYTAEEYTSIRQSSEGSYVGIGVTVTQDFTITAVPEDSPAWNAGIRPGDRLMGVEGHSTEGMTFEEFREYAKGAEGDVRHLSVRTGEQGETREVEITLAPIETKTVRYSKLEDGVWYLQIEHFLSVTDKQFAAAWEVITADPDFSGLILDLRNNPGGGIDPTIAIAQSLVPEGLITYVVEKDGTRIDYTSQGTGCPVPMVVLINGSSASASELMSGALKDHGTASIVGETSFGKGIVQTTWSMSDGTAFKMTTALYYTPNGINIQGTGIEPDLYVELTPEEKEDPNRDWTTDTQAKAALEELHRLMQEAKQE